MSYVSENAVNRLDESMAEAAANAADHHGISLSERINTAAGRALVLEVGLAAVREREAEHCELAVEALTWADGDPGDLEQLRNALEMKLRLQLI